MRARNAREIAPRATLRYWTQQIYLTLLFRQVDHRLIGATIARQSFALCRQISPETMRSHRRGRHARTPAKRFMRLLAIRARPAGDGLARRATAARCAYLYDEFR